MTNILGMSGFIDWLTGLGHKSVEKKYLFRGVSSKKYDPVEASSYRRLLKNEFGRTEGSNRKTLSNLLKVNRDLIDEARFRGYAQNMIEFYPIWKYLVSCNIFGQLHV